MAYAVIRTGGKQYRVEEGTTLLVERLTADEGATIDLEPLLVAGDGDPQLGGDLDGVVVQAEGLGHVRGPKLRVFKFKPKRGYKRRLAHRQALPRVGVPPRGGRAARASRAKTEKETAPDGA